MLFTSVHSWLKGTRKSTLHGRRESGPSRRPKPPCQLRLEVLEDRTVPATFTVTNLTDAGVGSLRQAIADSNGTTQENDIIVFQPGLTGTITLTTGQLSVTRPVTITGPGSGALTINGNNASRIFLVDNGSTTLNNVAISGLTLTRGLATGLFLPGGGIQVTSENLVLSDMVITGNTAERGGGIAVGPNGRLTMLNSTVSNNNATTSNSGGGVYVDSGGSLTVENSTISSNMGGGINTKGTLVVRNSTIAGNSAGSGGGILAEFGTLTVENSTISGNSASNGGGLWIRSTTATIRNSTIAFNTIIGATPDGGGIRIDDFGGPSSLTLQSTIVALNTRGAAGLRDDIASNAVVAAGANNLIGDGSGLTGLFNGLSSNQVGTAAAPLNPLLGPLQNNGGTMQTHGLLAGSPAVNAGFNFAGQLADQRGGLFPRTFGPATDVGAFEVQAPPLPPKPPFPAPQLPPQVAEIVMKRVKLRTRVDVLVNGTLSRRFFPFGAFKGRVKVQRVDVNGDGVLDVIARATINGKKRTRTFVT